ncbi:hypothetical protein FFLO_06071 [Filobasidium floriforme]|uniref:GPI ethanolamine phosphate transferase 1 n=1 Tax=Filobasidium floriforme TaxID=5210 RepID=A0A8K0JL90_9TREE|nr:hypothetical protein FFLO_06071 [Filobasidium floriforme]
MAAFPRSSRTVVGLGLVLHLTYLLAMFDTYFHSPIVHIDRSHPVNEQGDETLADRLVLMVADGLRADLVFTPTGSPRIPLPSGEVMAPYLRSIIEERGCFGISHARVPTESRPGREYELGGLWEDPSAVFKGWKHNPVNFDSILNQSSTAFTFGSPDILPIFASHPPGGKREDDPLDPDRKVLMWMYHEDDEDFTSDATRLDAFSFDRFQSLLHRAQQDDKLARRLRAPGTVFFLHLLGLDTTGHGFGPHSKEYIDSIQYVDNIVRKVEQEMRFFFQDDRTAYLFTADHGMSNIGNHGDGHPDNTRTPYITWGSGIRSPLTDSVPSSHDQVSQPWGFNGLLRRDVDQVDLTMLMAALVGGNWPKNSVGILPEDLLQPAVGVERTRARLMLGNAKSVLEQFDTKQKRTAARKLNFRPFTSMLDVYGEDPVLSIIQQLDAGDYKNATETARQIAGMALDGLAYYDTYEQSKLRSIVSLGYTFFGIYILLYVRHVFGINKSAPTPQRNALPADILTIAAGATVIVGAVIEESPWHAIYAAFPIYLGRAILVNLWEGSSGIRIRTHNIAHALKWLAQLALYSGALVAMAMGYKHRIVWCLGFLPLGVRAGLQGELSLANFCRKSFPFFSAAAWALLPVERDEDLRILIAGAAINYGFIVYCFSKSCTSTDLTWTSAKRTFGVQLYFSGALSVYAIWAAYSLGRKDPINSTARGAGWILLAYSILFPLFSGFKAGQSANLRLALLYNTFSASYLLLSQSWEILFLINYAAVIAVWMNSETTSRAPDSTAYRLIQTPDAARALSFLFLVHAGFFCTGNVASIASFYLAPVYRLVPVFQPAIMSTLLMYKIIVPFILLSAAFASICSRQRLPPFALILLTLAMSEPLNDHWLFSALLAICLFFFRQVQTTGSWLEIGSSISHFAIASLLIAYNVFLNVIGEFVMRGAISGSPIRKKID